MPIDTLKVDASRTDASGVAGEELANTPLNTYRSHFPKSLMMIIHFARRDFDKWISGYSTEDCDITDTLTELAEMWVNFNTNRSSLNYIFKMVDQYNKLASQDEDLETDILFMENLETVNFMKGKLCQSLYTYAYTQ